MAVAEERHLSDATFEIPLTEIHLPDDNVRSKVGDVAELAKSIEAVGILEPIVVTERRRDVATPGGQEIDGVVDGFLVVCGSRRVSAAAAAGLTHVPAIVREFTDEQRVEAMVVENLQRENLTPVEEAAAFQRLVDMGSSQRTIATRLGVSQGHVSKRLALLALPAVAHEALDAGGITIDQAVELAKISDLPKVVTKAVKEATKYPASSAAIITTAVRDAERARKCAATVAELEEKGKRAVAMGSSYDVPQGLAIVSENGYFGGQVVRMQPSKHRKLACHVTGVAPGFYNSTEPQLVDLCSDPAKHPAETSGSTTPTAHSRETKEDKKRREHLTALDEARTRRLPFLKSLCAKRLPKDELLALTTIALTTGDVYGADEELPYYLLGLVDDENTEAQVNEITLRQFIEQGVGNAASGDAARARAAAAIAFGILEGNLGMYGRGYDEHGLYYEFLKRKGYEISPAEKLELDGKAPS